MDSRYSYRYGMDLYTGRVRTVTPSGVARAVLLAFVVVALRFDPRDPQPVQYTAELRARIPTATPTGAGYTAWLAANNGTPDAPTRLFAASRVAFLPTEVSHGHEDTGFGWYPGGTVVPVSKPLP